MSESTNSASKPLFDDSAFNILHQLEREADFLYSAVEKYIRDAEKDSRPGLIKMWNTIKEDERNHLRMLREELIREIKENRF